VYSHYERIMAQNPAISGHAYNDSVSGAKVAGTLSQAQAAVAQQAQYVTILIGGNDVCTPSISSMTPTAQFTTAFQSTMSALESGLPPGAHIFVSSIPNIYGLWSVLHGNPTAQLVWSFAKICQSMLATTNTEAQRQQVVAQEQADNAALSQVCGLYANCRWDGYATFDHQFSAADVSTLDYFHPSQTGQAVLASLTWGASWWASSSGYWEVASDGGIFSFGDAGFFGSMGGQTLNEPIVGMAALNGRQGYWLVAADGGLFNFGDAGFFGSMGGKTLNEPIVGMAATPDGLGYWEVASDGGIFDFGDAAFFGSMGGMALNKPIVGMAATPDGLGYWEVASDGGIFDFGDAAFFGSAGSLPLNSPVVGMATAPGGSGYWLVAADGGIFTYGSAGFFGSAGAVPLNKPVVDMAATPDGGGYWLVASDGGIFDYGDAPYLGSMGGTSLAAPVVGAASAST
jgi:lysophospholipase L1-like esterase